MAYKIEEEKKEEIKYIMEIKGLGKEEIIDEK